MTRTRNYNITINQDAECYSNLENSLIEQQNCFWAMITHNKDKINENEPKKEHKHLVISFDNARTFESIKKMFPGAHIEPVIELSSSIQYLTHKNDTTKEQYDYKTILTNNTTKLQELYDFTKVNYPLLNEQIIESIMLYGKNYQRNLIYFYKTYGNEQVKKYRQMILDYAKGYNEYIISLQEQQEEEELDKILPF